MIPEVARLREKAHTALNNARHDLSGGFTGGAVNRAYYAAFHMARAALLMKGEAPRSHKGVQVRFRRHFVRSGQIVPGAAAALARAAQLREEADYDDGARIETGEAQALIQDVERFLDALEPLLAEDSGADQ